MTSYPDDLQTMKELENLDLSSNYFGYFPKDLKLPKLQTLNLSTNSLASFEGVFPSLVTLDIANNNFSYVPTAIFNLSALRRLDLRGNNLTDITLTTAQFSFLQELEELDADSFGDIVCNTTEKLQTKENSSNKALIAGVMAAALVLLLILGIIFNDGCFEFEPAEMHRLERWSDVKMGLAHALYSEEELFAVGSADDIALYTFPDGLPTEESEDEVKSLVQLDSRWVLDIFGSPFRQRSDLHIQTDHAICGVRRGSATAFQSMDVRRVSALHHSMPISPLGNAAHGGFHETNVEGYHEPYIHIGPRILYDGVYHLDPDEMQRGFVQVVRLWFSFDCEQTISVTKVNGALGLKPLRQQDGWIVVQALPGSPCFEAAHNKMSESAAVREFNNIPARTREQREAVCDKEQREKERLRARKEGFIRVDTSAAGSAMLVYTPQSQGFMSDADRFHSDTAGEERVAREEARARARIQQERRRHETVNRDVRRWDAMDAASAEEKRRLEALRASGSKARRNKGGEPFNPITLKYNDGKDGERLQAADTAIKQRAMLRAQNLQYHNSREGINPITGESVRRIQTRDLLPPSQ
ncbi:hypothetical protein JG687_00005475 [Phytophthora cactorum]|uniref:Leucine-rich repeat domain, L domain-like n=2 Tax=Phytophthora cactorum TaxID=29920 RepID=A0A8T1UQ88_9STRA|nr:hypothetical protein JG687_00005475 [Phytophthora cactorum]